MPNALVTIIAPLDPDRIRQAEGLIDGMGNPPTPEIDGILDACDGEGGVHFVSLHAFRSVDGARGYILLELSADGTDEQALAVLVTAIGDRLKPVFMLSSDWTNGDDLLRYLTRHQVKVGPGWLDNPGLAFAGTPGIGVARVRAEDKLARAVTAMLARQLPRKTGARPMSALERVNEIRREIAANPALAFALEPATPEPSFEPADTPSLVIGLLGSFIRTFLWPIGALLLLVALIAGILAAHAADASASTLGVFVLTTLQTLWGGFWIALILLLIAVVWGYSRLREAEAEDWLEEHPPTHALNEQMFRNENRAAQNHMISVTQRKPGFIRATTLRLVFWIIAGLSGRLYRPGFLGTIGTIHFARWVTPPGSHDLIFLSNFGGSWESYLEDFITRAHAGLTGIWSNTIGFPRSQNLFQKGATDGDRFKRFARHSMVPTRFWYSAYPHLTTASIRTNAAIRRGLSGVMTEDEAIAWLALFGSAPRPADKIVSSGIQSLVFGGLGFMPFGCCLVLDLPEDRAAAKAWLAEIMPRIAFDDGRRLGASAVLTLSLGARGLERLGLPPSGLETFPFAFLDGMTAGHRTPILGDTGENAPEHWRWGRTAPDVALLVYGVTAEDRDALEEDVLRIGRDHGAGTPHRIALKEVTKNKSEPFGFVDGVSQPVIRGTYKGLREPDPIHLVEPGEFILGYPDNRGTPAPGPTLSALDDPENMLPLASRVDGFDRNVVESARDIGFNGSYLVIRELEQDVAAFEEYCGSEATRLSDSLPPPYHVDAEFIGAKIVGRWKDGSSLVRNPYESRTSFRDKLAVRLRAQGEEARGAMQISGANEDQRSRSVPTAGQTAVDATAARQHDRPAGDNTFLFGAEDPEGIRCPFGAHVRRANPRDSQDPNSADQIAISNRHRIMRVGRLYDPGENARPGLFFMCLNADIERQFEFLQQSWLMSPSFHGLSCEKDPLMGDAEKDRCGYTLPSRYGPLRLEPVPRFVTVRGGGYFFLPGKRLLAYLAARP